MAHNKGTTNKLNEQTQRETAIALRQIANTLAYFAAQSESMKNRKNTEKIPLLHRLGFDQAEIASILDTTIGTVRKELSIRKSDKIKKKNNGE